MLSGGDHHDKVPYPPAYTEIYPTVPAGADMNSQNMGWQPPSSAPPMVVTEQPPVYVTQQPGKREKCLQIS